MIASETRFRMRLPGADHDATARAFDRLPLSDAARGLLTLVGAACRQTPVAAFDSLLVCHCLNRGLPIDDAAVWSCDQRAVALTLLAKADGMSAPALAVKLVVGAAQTIGLQGLCDAVSASRIAVRDRLAQDEPQTQDAARKGLPDLSAEPSIDEGLPW